jgi:uridine monophosphate synthetase
MAQSFVSKLTTAIEDNNSLLCVGLDPDPYRFPTHFPNPPDGPTLASWGCAIVEQTADLVCCYKPNVAFYEQFGPPGLAALQQTIAAIPDDIPVLLDAKRGDIGSTAAAYARAAFEVWQADAITLSPYLGRDGVLPFLGYPGKTVFILCYTSNPSAATIQEYGANGALYEHILLEAARWGRPSQIGFVVGATQPHALARVRVLLEDRPYWILAPGVGAQGGDLSAALAAGLNKDGSGLILPVSRSVLYAKNPRQAANTLRSQINRARISSPATHHPSPATRHSPHSHSTIQPFSHPATTSFILHLHDVGCVQFGDFTLASGQKSPIYLDLRRLASYPDLLQLAASLYVQQLKRIEYDRLAAVPYGALTLATAVALATHSSLIYPRKEVKSHGTSRAVEGDFSAGEKAVVIEDLVTSGGSVLTAISTLEAAGLSISDVVVLIDREQGGAANLAEAGYRLHAALTMSQILETLRSAGRISQAELEAIRT